MSPNNTLSVSQIPVTSVKEDAKGYVRISETSAKQIAVAFGPMLPERAASTFDRSRVLRPGDPLTVVFHLDGVFLRAGTEDPEHNSRVIPGWKKSAGYKWFGKQRLCEWNPENPLFSSWEEVQERLDAIYSTGVVFYTDYALDCSGHLDFERLAQHEGILVDSKFFSATWEKTERCKKGAYNKFATVVWGGAYEGPIFSENTRLLYAHDQVVQFMLDEPSVWEHGYTRFEYRAFGKNLEDAQTGFAELGQDYEGMLAGGYILSKPLVEQYAEFVAVLDKTVSVITRVSTGEGNQFGVYTLYARPEYEVKPPKNLAWGRTPKIITGYGDALAFAEQHALANKPHYIFSCHEAGAIIVPAEECAKRPLLADTFATSKHPNAQGEWVVNGRKLPENLPHIFSGSKAGLAKATEKAGKNSKVWNITTEPIYGEPETVQKMVGTRTDWGVYEYEVVEEKVQYIVGWTTKTGEPEAAVQLPAEMVPAYPGRGATGWSKLPKTAVLIAVEGQYVCCNGQWFTGAPVELVSNFSGFAIGLVEGRAVSKAAFARLTGKKAAELLAKYGSYM